MDEPPTLKHATATWGAVTVVVIQRRVVYGTSELHGGWAGMCRIARALNGKNQVELLPKTVDCLFIVTARAAGWAIAAVPSLFVWAVLTITDVVVQPAGGNRALGTIRAPEGPILTSIEVILVACLVRRAPRNASVAGKFAFICAGWTITVPIVETVDTDRAIAERARKVDVKTWLLTRIRLNQNLNLRKGTRKA